MSKIPAENTPAAIADKWVKRIGRGFHPDTPGESYTPEFSAADAAEYDADMGRLFEMADDPYAVCVEAMDRAGMLAK